MSMQASNTEALDNLVQRAEALLAEEVAVLRACRPLEHSSFVARKTMIAFELDTIARTDALEKANPVTRARLASLRARLDENRRLLEIHIAASREITRILSEIVQAADWDGTYTVAPSRRGRRA